MKFTIDKTLIKYSVYIVVIATVLYVIYRIVSNLEFILATIFSVLSGFLGILSPFITALVLTYLLYPIVNWIELKVMYNNRYFKSKNPKDDKYRSLKRTLSVLLTYILVFSVLTVLLYSTYAMIGGKISQQVDFQAVIESISNYSGKYNEIYNQLRMQLETSGLSENLKKQFIEAAENINEILGSAITRIFAQVGKIGSNVINIVLGLVITFYLLKDMEYFKRLFRETANKLIGNRKNEKMRSFLMDVNGIVSKFIRGQLLDALIVGILTSIGLSLIGLDFAFLIGITAGISNVIPYFGPIIGSVPAVIVGLLSDSPVKALFAVIVMVVVQQIDSALIAPRVVGDSVGLHPVFVMLSIIIGGAYFGLIGMLIAVPAAAIIKMFLLRWAEDRKSVEQ
jgi:predicted PurR-regulated permease PerM